MNEIMSKEFWIRVYEDLYKDKTEEKNEIRKTNKMKIAIAGNAGRDDFIELGSGRDREGQGQVGVD